VILGINLDCDPVAKSEMEPPNPLNSTYRTMNLYISICKAECALKISNFPRNPFQPAAPCGNPTAVLPRDGNALISRDSPLNLPDRQSMWSVDDSAGCGRGVLIPRAGYRRV
jgi:hypothetical protein